jgi:hypothetical protein
MFAGIVAGGAFLVSFTFGIFGRTPVYMALTRALIFSGVFFGIVAGIYFIFNKFLQPMELPPDKTNYDDGQLGQNIDFSLGDEDGLTDADAAPPDTASLEELQSVDMEEGSEGIPVVDSSAGVLEQISNNVYSKSGSSSLPQAAADSAVDGYNMDMGAFVPGIPGIDGNGAQKMSDYADSPDLMGAGGVVEMSVERNSEKDPRLTGDAKKMAGAIQTLLKKDDG